MDREVFEWQLEGESYQEKKNYRREGWSGPVDERYSRHRIRLFDRWYDGYAVDHHLAHIAGALFTSPFDSAGILSADGGGDLRMCALAFGSGNRLHHIEYGWALEDQNQQLNIGSVWASIGEHHFGMKRLEGAGKLMGLASYGSPRDELVAMLKEQMLHRHYKPLPLKRFGVGNDSVLEPNSPFAKDVCASLQHLTTELYLSAASRIKSWPQAIDHLVMTGGCSMNCIANTAIHRSALFDGTWVPAQPHDGGLSLGQALFVWHHVLERPRTAKEWSPYLGTDAGPISENHIPDIIKFLEQGRSVGLCYGRAESGPRALGHRTILLDPRIKDGKDRLNQHVKHREWYRPFAPMVLGTCDVPSKYMSYVIDLDAAQVPAVTHVDGTSRPQMVSKGDDPFIFQLLSAWKAKTGCSMLLNTSFNCQEPLVDTVEQARATWRRTGLDVLVSSDGIETEKPVSIEHQEGNRCVKN
jgi:carbamoyltransferase